MKPWIVRIRALMAERKITQEALAEAVGHGQSWVNHKLSGRRNTSVDDMVLIASALNVDPAVLVSNVTNPQVLKQNFIGVAESDPPYVVDRVDEIQARMAKLSKTQRDQVFDDLEDYLDRLGIQ